MGSTKASKIQRTQKIQDKKAQVEARLGESGWEVDVRLSTRRTKSIAARQEGNKIVLLAPAAMGVGELVEAAEGLMARVEKKAGRTRGGMASDEELEERARRLNRTHLQGRARWSQIVWVTNMKNRWGSCSPETGKIRISHRLQAVPDYVLDSVVIHELVHTWVPNHGPEFWAWATKAPHLEKAQGYLEAYHRWGSA